MTKTPYELRFDLLQFAYNTLQSKYYAELEEVKYIQGLIAAGKATSETELNLPPYPSVEEVFKLAEDYKKFIDQR